MRKILTLISSLLVSILLPLDSQALGCNNSLDNPANTKGVAVICSSSEKIHENILTYSQANQTLIDKATPSIYLFLNSYSSSLLSTSLSRLFLVKDIQYLNSSVGGISDGKNILVNLNNYPGDLNMVYGTILHHEFSSNIYKNNSFTSRISWKLNGNYYVDTVEFLKTCLDNSTFAWEESSQLYKMGFIRNYSRTNPENDFNVYAETLFTKPQKIKQLAIEYPLIRKKLIHFKQFYRNAGFTGKFPDEP